MSNRPPVQPDYSLAGADETGLFVSGHFVIDFREVVMAVYSPPARFQTTGGRVIFTFRANPVSVPYDGDRPDLVWAAYLSWAKAENQRRACPPPPTMRLRKENDEPAGEC